MVKLPCGKEKRTIICDQHLDCFLNWYFLQLCHFYASATLSDSVVSSF